jgi:hypothetical protein
MKLKNRFVPVVIAGAAIAATVGSFAIAQPEGQAPAGQPDFPLPPGWTPEDMEACMVAGTPGEMHAFLATHAGTWDGQCTMWMYPGADPMESACTSTITPIMDGRYVRVTMDGEMPGMGTFTGEGTYGFDNVSKKFVSSWIDDHSTGIWDGTGALSPDKKTLTWSYTYNCPVTEKPAVAREVERFTSPTTKTLEMFGKDPKTGEEFKMMSIKFTKKS